MGDFDLNAFATQFSVGARSYLFMLSNLSFPGDATSTSHAVANKYFVRSTSLPEETVEEITVNWMGSDHKLSGKRTYNDWTVTFNSDDGYYLREMFNSWVHIMQGEGDTSVYATSYSSYAVGEVTFKVLKGDFSTAKILTLYHVWPKSVGPISLDYSTQDIAQFDVTFSYRYHKFSDEAKSSASNTTEIARLANQAGIRVVITDFMK